METTTLLNIGAIALLVTGGFLGLAWYEDRGAETEQVGHERLGLALSAPATQARGPWDGTTVFTEASAGIPLQVAPNATLEARHTAGGAVKVLDHRWTATLHLEQKGDGARPWWTVEEPVPLVTSTDQATATVELPLAEIADRALDLQNESGMPGRLDVKVTVTHRANVTVLAGPQASELTSTLRLDPREGYLIPEPREDSQTYSQVTDSQPPWTAGGIALAGLATAGVAQIQRSRAPAWHRARGVTTVEVQGHEPPAGPVTGIDELLATARDQGAPVLVDAEAGWASLAGPVELRARLEAGRAHADGSGSSDDLATGQANGHGEVEVADEEDDADVVGEVDGIDGQALGPLDDETTGTTTDG